MPPTLRKQLEARLGSIPDVVCAPAVFADDDGYWVDAKEILHFHAPDAVEVRLTRAEIRARRTELRADPRVALRPSTSSDWLEVRFARRADVDFVVALAEVAAAAHRPPRGQAVKPPPTGSDLERRRRFH